MYEVNFQDDNTIQVIPLQSQGQSQSDCNLLCKFKDTYTITIYSCTAVGLNLETNEVYMKLDSYDESLATFMNQILTTLGVTDGSIEKTISTDNLLNISCNETTILQKEIQFAGKENKLLRLPFKLSKHFQIISNNTVSLTIILENFKIIQSKYIIMKFDLSKITLHNDSLPISLPAPKPEVEAEVKFDDFFNSELESDTDDASDTSNLNIIYDSQPTVKVNLADSEGHTINAW